MVGSDLAIIIPAYNEERSIQTVVRGAAEFGRVIVVDDCSKDGTRQSAENAGAIVVRHTANAGYDAALNTGFARAADIGCRYVITMDADGQHSPRQLSEISSLLKSGNKLVIGVRPSAARMSETLFSWYTSVAYGVTDPLCGMKGYHMDLYSDLGHFDSYQSIGTELMLHGLRHRWPHALVTVPIRDRYHGTSRFAQTWRANLRILRALVLSIVNRFSR